VCALAILIAAAFLPIFRNEPTVFDGAVPAWSQPVYFRALNLFLHLLATSSVFGIGRRLLPGTNAALAAAVLFAVHPVHVDAVARAGCRGQLILTAVLLLLMWLALSRSDGKHIFRFATGGLVAFAIWSVGQVYFSPEADFVANPLVSSTLPVRLMTGVHLIARSLGLLIWPYRLSPDYSYDSLPMISDPGSWTFLLSAVTVIGLAVPAFLRGRNEPLYPLSYIWCVGAIAAAINPWMPRRAIMAEHFLYFPSVAFCWALAQLFHDAGWMVAFDRRSIKSAKPLILIVIFLVLPWSAKTYIRTAQWETERTVLETAARVFPDNAHVQVLLGDFHFREGALLAAERRYRRALGIYPSYTEAQHKLESTLKLLGR
jgi:hypothetical protein